MIIIALFLASCSSTGVSESTTLFVTNKNDEQATFKKYNYKFKILYLDTNDRINYIKHREVFKKFGDSLGKVGVVTDFQLLSINNRKRKLDKIQKILGTNYSYYDAPFLVFYKENMISKLFTPYEIISFKNSPVECTKGYLLDIEKAIYSDTDKNKIIKKLDTIMLSTCQATGIVYGTKIRDKFIKLSRLLTSLFK